MGPERGARRRSSCKDVTEQARFPNSGTQKKGRHNGLPFFAFQRKGINCPWSCQWVCRLPSSWTSSFSCRQSRRMRCLICCNILQKQKTCCKKHLWRPSKPTRLWSNTPQTWTYHKWLFRPWCKKTFGHPLNKLAQFWPSCRQGLEWIVQTRQMRTTRRHRGKEAFS